MPLDDDSPIHVSLWIEVLHHVRLAEPKEGTPEHIHWQAAMELLTTGRLLFRAIPGADPMSINLTPFDAAEVLKNDPGGMAPLLHFAFQSEDAPHIVDAIGIVARAKGIDLPEIEADPSLSTLILALNKLGYRLTVERIVVI